jgi:mono/diheme cytochrome c family protein
MFRIFPLLGLAALLSASCYSADSTKVERGRYLAEDVGKCQDCHSPRLETGELDKTRWMKGAVLDVQPLQTIQGWHKTAPDITPAGRLFTRWGEAGLVKFMSTGLNPGGKPADRPMPTYKLSKDDAEALVEYLKTLK